MVMSSFPAILMSAKADLLRRSRKYETMYKYTEGKIPVLRMLQYTYQNEGVVVRKDKRSDFAIRN